MYIKIRGTRIGINTEAEFIINMKQLKTIEVLRDTKIAYLVGDTNGIILNDVDFENLKSKIEIIDCMY